MAQPMRDEVVYYFDVHPTEEDLMGETPPHSWLVHYLMDVLTWLFQKQVCAIHENYNFYQTSNERERPLVPDIAIIKGIPTVDARSYRVGVYGPPPQVVFEIASVETWKNDLQEKPGAYARMGVEEYYAYDPNQPPLSLSRKKGRRLFGWQRDHTSDILREIQPDSRGWLWSPRLDSYLVPDGKLLHFADHFGNLRLTQVETLAKKLRELGVDPDQLV